MPNEGNDEGAEFDGTGADTSLVPNPTDGTFVPSDVAGPPKPPLFTEEVVPKLGGAGEADALS